MRIRHAGKLWDVWLCDDGTLDTVIEVQPVVKSKRNLNKGGIPDYDYPAQEVRFDCEYVDKAGKPLPGETPETVRKNTLEDYERMESLNRGNWCFLGIAAEAEIGLPCGIPGSVTVQWIHSSGLWGIESDSDKAFLADTEKEQLADLKDQLRALGFSARAISLAFQTIEREEE